MNIPLNIDWQQILLHLFNFVLLFGILYFLLYKPVKKFMDKRTEYYKNMDDEARSKLEQAEALKQEYADRLAQIDTEISAKQKAAQIQFNAEKERYLNAAQKESDRLLNKAKTEAQQTHDEMIRQTNIEITDMVSSAAEKIVFTDTDQAFESFLDEVEGRDQHE